MLRRGLENINHGFMTEIRFNSGRLFQEIFNTVREAILVLDEHMRVLSANRSFFNIFKVASSDTIDLLYMSLETGNGTSHTFVYCSRNFYRRTTQLMTMKLNIILRASERKPCCLTPAKSQ